MKYEREKKTNREFIVSWKTGNLLYFCPNQENRELFDNLDCLLRAEFT